MRGARGMFRWAAYHLDTLGKFRNREMLRRSLAMLPPTLDQTYDRILSATSDEYSEYAIRILQWLTFSARPLFVEEVAEVVAIEVAHDPAFDRDEVLEDPLEALNIRTSLVTIITNEEEESNLARKPWLFDPDVPWEEPDLGKGLESVAAPLYYEAQLGLSPITKLLLDHDAEVNAQVVKMLLDKGAIINAQGKHYGNALQVASFRGHEQVVELLLAAGADYCQ
ncbi:hypothetical protein K458DRAFT_391986 [Lentithecium fluviatile CBS 122367]|uniref:Uncharacterized protein n=1 Tax=Lentithecium fluviatile CBS 122367 TaxID=1168545 RepID=A0A6G1ITC2_9PLEO|nr:hypothetical protein K458DRAFT_391986 [Lentithecium fluviatile CBS 122367]